MQESKRSNLSLLMREVNDRVFELLQANYRGIGGVPLVPVLEEHGPPVERQGGREHHGDHGECEQREGLAARPLSC